MASLIHDPSLLKLGKKPAVLPLEAPRFADYAAALVPAPMSCYQQTKVSNLGMMLNDTLGDCVSAASGHSIQVWTADNGAQVIPTDADVEKFYEVSGGYVPGDSRTDNGTVIFTALTDFHSVGLGGHKITGFAHVTPTNGQEVTNAVYYFGSLMIGVNLPIDAQNQTIWTVTHGPNAVPGSWGGHCILVVGYDSEYLYAITWGEIKKIAWQWYRTYCDEAWVMLSPDWLSAAGKCPDGFNFTQLQADLKVFI